MIVLEVKPYTLQAQVSDSPQQRKSLRKFVTHETHEANHSIRPYDITHSIFCIHSQNLPSLPHRHKYKTADELCFYIDGRGGVEISLKQKKSAPN